MTDSSITKRNIKNIKYIAAKKLLIHEQALNLLSKLFRSDHLEEYRKMYLFMYQHLIRNFERLLKVQDNLENMYEEIISNKQSENEKLIPIYIYEDFRALSLFYIGYLNNIIGDTERNAVSYHALTAKKMVQKYNLNLSEKDENDRILLNDFVTNRDWSLHFNKKQFKGFIETKNSEFLNNNVEIINSEYIDIAMVESLIDSNQNTINKVYAIKKNIEKDFESIFKNKIKIKHINVSYIAMESLDVAKVSSDIQWKRRKF